MLLGVVRYGEYYLFLTSIKRPSEEIPEVSMLFTVRQEGGQYLHSNSLSGDIATSFFQRPGTLQDEIYRRLEQFHAGR